MGYVRSSIHYILYNRWIYILYYTDRKENKAIQPDKLKSITRI